MRFQLSSSPRCFHHKTAPVMYATSAEIKDTRIVCCCVDSYTRDEAPGERGPGIRGLMSERRLRAVVKVNGDM